MAKNERPVTLAEHLAKARAAKAANEAKMTREQITARYASRQKAAVEAKKAQAK
jgi:hypothetical protein